MSRFWAAQSSSEEEGGSDSDSSAELRPQPIQKQGERRFGAAFDESDSDSEDEVRVVKSQRVRAWDSMREGIVRIRNARKNSDWPLIQDEFAKVNKMIEKSKMLILQNGIPKFYIKMLGELEDHVQAAAKDKENIKKLKPVVSRALNQMKLQVKKHNDAYKEQIADFRANPDLYAEEEAACESESDASSSSGSDSESSSDAGSGSDSDSSDDDSDKKKTAAAAKSKPAPKAKPARGDVDDESEEDSLFGDQSEDSDSSSESEDDGRKELKGRARWLKKGPDNAAQAARDAKKEARVSKSAAPKTKAGKRDISETMGGAKPARNYAAEEQMTEEEIDQKIADLIASRGKRSTDPREALRQLEVLTKAARLHGPKKEITVQMQLISAMLDSVRSIDDYLELQQWRSCHRSLNRVLKLLDENKSIILGVVGSDEVSEMALAARARQVKIDDVVSGGAAGSASPTAVSATATATAGTTTVGKDTFVRVVGSVESYIVRLEDEYTKSLQQINPHTQEYVVRLADEAALVEQAEAGLSYYQRVGNMNAAANIALLIAEHLYYTHDTHAVAVRKAHAFHKKWGKYSDLHPGCAGSAVRSSAAGADQPVAEETAATSAAFPSSSVAHPASFVGNPSVSAATFVPGDRLAELCTFIFSHADERSKTRALLCSVYHHAMHDRYYVARDLLLISHIQDFIEKADIRTQILYNRTIVQMGLCAFRLGLYQKAHDCLTGICSGRVKELLAQGQSKGWSDKDPEQEKVERRRQMPYHMHINPDLLECCHLTCAMLLELPNMARRSVGTPSSTYVISKQFRKYMQSYSKRVFTGPPENTREHVLAATMALLEGEWKKAVEYLTELEVWRLVPNDGGDQAKEMLRIRIKEEAIRTFLLLNGQHYDSISLQLLCSMFDMDEATTRRIISRMIFHREISAAWEHPADVLIMYKLDPTQVQTLSQSLSEKVGQMAECSERVLDPMVGLYGYKDDWGSGGGGDQRGRGRPSGGRGDESSGGRGRGGKQGYYKQGNRPMPISGRGGGRGGRGGRGGGGNRHYNKSSNVSTGRGEGGGGGSSSNDGGQRRKMRYQSAQDQQNAPQPKRWGAPAM